MHGQPSIAAISDIYILLSVFPRGSLAYSSLIAASPESVTAPLSPSIQGSPQQAESRALQNDPHTKFHPRCESQQTKVFGMKRNETGFWNARKLLKTWWPGTESNRRRQPFQGCALPFFDSRAALPTRALDINALSHPRLAHRMILLRTMLIDSFISGSVLVSAASHKRRWLPAGCHGNGGTRAWAGIGF